MFWIIYASLAITSFISRKSFPLNGLSDAPSLKQFSRALLQKINASLATLTHNKSLVKISRCNTGKLKAFID